MDNYLLVWLIWLLLLASPFTYLVGRLGRKLPYRLARNAALAAALLAWWPFVEVYRAFATSGPITYTLGAVALRLDGMSLLLTAVVLALTTLVILFSGPDIAGSVGEEKYYAMLLAMSGVMIGLSCAADLFNLWIWFEGIAVTSFLLVAFYRDEAASLEAGVKYLVQSAAGSVLVLLGIALVLSQTGTLDLALITAAIPAAPAPGVLVAAGALFFIGFGVKVALVPLHTWLPDAHAQAPSGVSAMLSGVVIEAALIVLLRVTMSLVSVTAIWGQLLMLFGALNMLVGNLMALRQTQIKRLLAFSSVAHVGYMLLGVGIGVYAGSVIGAQGGFFHLLSHGLMKGLAFLAAGALLYGLHTAGEHTPLLAADVAGAARRYPLLALAFSLALLGLGGLPPLVGFMSKWQILLAGFTTHSGLVIGLVIFAAANSVLSLAYYAPLVNAMYRQRPSSLVQRGRPLPMAMTAPILLLAAAIVAIGVWPGLVYNLIEPAGAALLTFVR